MNPTFLSYQNSKHFFLSEIDNVSIEKWSDYLNSKQYSYDYDEFDNVIVTSFTADKEEFKFFEFPRTNTGFLGKVELHTDFDKSKFDHLHLELNRLFGVIIASYSLDESKELSGYSTVFSISEQVIGLGELEPDYVEKCLESNMPKDDQLLNLVTIASEFNGNLIQYNQDGAVYYYLPDHLRNNRYIKVEDTPPDTFYTSHDISRISDWVKNYFKQYFV